MRALGLDLGAKRIGVAVSDRDGRLATPADVLHRTGDRARDHRAVADLVVEWEAEVVVVGVPYSLDGGTGPAAEAMIAESRQLARALDVPEERGGALDPVAVVVALDLLGVYLREMGAIGGPVGDRD